MVGIMYLENNFNTQAAQCTLALQDEIEECRGAEEAENLAKSPFLAKITHELRSPLNAILGFSQLMSHSNDLSPEHQESLKIIIRNSEYLLTLINQILDISKIEAQQTTLNENEFDLHQLLDDLKNMFQLTADDKGLELLFHCDGEVPRYMRGDEVKLRQVLINLLSNALKFTSTGSINLYIKGEKLTPDCLNFEISDTGCGIAESEFSRIFEPFVQAPTERKFSDGTGLGLTIARSLVQLMGGDLSVSSCVGSGSTFQFSIPICVVKPELPNEWQLTQHITALAPNQTINHIVPNETCVLTKAELDTIPKNLVANLYHALIALDVESIQKNISLFYKFNPFLSQALEKLAIDFQYERILDFIQLSNYKNFQLHELRSSKYNGFQLHELQYLY
jgi:nitrogen-specific signal transduction histidine kinase